jgi:hypothetical protein
MNHRSLSRREFLKLAAAGAGILALPRPVSSLQSLPDFPQAEQLGRAAKGSILLKSRPDLDSQTLGTLYEDAVVPWIREVIGERPAYVYNNQRWVETPDGFVYGPTLQPVRNLPNEPVTSLPQSSRGPGMWVEVTVPYVDVILENQPTSNSWVEIKVDEGLPLRFYYSQVFWVDQIRTNERGVFYRVNPNYYGGVDLLWGAAEAFRPVQAEELAPVIGWSAIFATGGVAVHSTFWHNNFGDPMSHGCVNVLPEDAKWLFRWTHPSVAFDPGMEDVTLSGKESTSVMVVEG